MYQQRISDGKSGNGETEELVLTAVPGQYLQQRSEVAVHATDDPATEKLVEQCDLGSSVTVPAAMGTSSNTRDGRSGNGETEELEREQFRDSTCSNGQK